MEDILLWGIAC